MLYVYDTSVSPPVQLARLWEDSMAYSDGMYSVITGFLTKSGIVVTPIFNPAAIVMLSCGLIDPYKIDPLAERLPPITPSMSMLIPNVPGSAILNYCPDFCGFDVQIGILIEVTIQNPPNQLDYVGIVTGLKVLTNKAMIGKDAYVAVQLTLNAPIPFAIPLNAKIYKVN